MSDFPADLPTSFDPAIYLHSETGFDHDAPTPATPSHSDELDALQQCIAEDKAQKKAQGIVIQHRAWRLKEAFRSDELYPIGTYLLVST